LLREFSSDVLFSGITGGSGQIFPGIADYGMGLLFVLDYGNNPVGGLRVLPDN
jgi:hypothetical protein